MPRRARWQARLRESAESTVREVMGTGGRHAQARLAAARLVLETPPRRLAAAPMSDAEMVAEVTRRGLLNVVAALEEADKP